MSEPPGEKSVAVKHCIWLNKAKCWESPAKTSKTEMPSIPTVYSKATEGHQGNSNHETFLMKY